METPEGPIFESNAIARYGLIPIPVSFGDLHLSFIDQTESTTLR